MQKIVKPLAWSLLGGGLAVMSTAGAIDLPWFKGSARPAAARTISSATGGDGSIRSRGRK